MNCKYTDIRANLATVDQSLDRLVHLGYFTEDMRHTIGNAVYKNDTEVTTKEEKSTTDNVWVNGSQAQPFVRAGFVVHDDTQLMLGNMRLADDHVSTTTDDQVEDELSNTEDAQATTTNPWATTQITESDVWGKPVKRERHQNIMVMKEGQIIGESAPRLGTETKAMRMMQKMGYVVGEGLGKSHQGKIEAIETKIKLSNAGLGATVLDNKVSQVPEQTDDETWESEKWANNPATVNIPVEPVPLEFSSYAPVRTSWKDIRMHKNTGIIVKFLQEGSVGEPGDIKLRSRIGHRLHTNTRTTRHLAQVMVEVVSGHRIPERFGRIPPLKFHVGDILQLECQKGKVTVAGNRRTCLMGEIEIAHCLMSEYIAPKQEESQNTVWAAPLAANARPVVMPHMRDHTAKTNFIHKYGQPGPSSYSEASEREKQEDKAKAITWADWEGMTIDYKREHTVGMAPQEEVSPEDIDWSVVEGYVE